MAEEVAPLLVTPAKAEALETAVVQLGLLISLFAQQMTVAETIDTLRYLDSLQADQGGDPLLIRSAKSLAAEIRRVRGIEEPPSR